jgi:hypothetical protein
MMDTAFSPIWPYVHLCSDYSVSSRKSADT